MQDPPTKIPPLVIMSLNIRTILNKQKNTNEIVAVSGLVCNQGIVYVDLFFFLKYKFIHTM